MTKNVDPSNDYTKLEKIAISFTNWVGSIASLVLHSILFAACFLLPFFGVPFEDVLLILTTVVSLEAIYLAIFIQMTVNRNTESLEEVEEDIDEIQGDIDEIQEDVDEIQEEVEDLQDDEIDVSAGHTPEIAIAKIQAALDELSAQLQKTKR